ncbi:hypothetical protein D3C87_1336230 [compost metagenome]
MGEVETRRYEPKIEVHTVALGGGVDPVEVADALAVDQRGDRAPSDAHRAALDLRPVRIESRVAYHVEFTLAGDSRFCSFLVDTDPGRVSEYLRHDAAVDVHFLIGFTVDFHIDHHRRKSSWNRGGSDHDFHEKVQCLRTTIGRDFSHVPDNGATRIEVCGSDQQKAALRVLGGDLLEHVLGHRLARQLQQRRIVRHCVAQNA